jgi:hypothetical protein
MVSACIRHLHILYLKLFRFLSLTPSSSPSSDLSEGGVYGLSSFQENRTMHSSSPEAAPPTEGGIAETMSRYVRLSLGLGEGMDQGLGHWGVGREGFWRGLLLSMRSIKTLPTTTGALLSSSVSRILDW